MNIRPHSADCENGKPCRRCYVRGWDRKRRDKTRVNKFTPRVEARKTDNYSAERVEELKRKGHENHVKRYSEKRAETLATNAKYRRNNKKRFAHYTAKHRASLLQATPPWADLQKIKQIYDNRPAGMEVDHIVPLQGKNVSGLHIHYNLQYLPLSENRSKGNRLKEG